MGWSSACQFKRLRSGDSFLGQGSLLVQGPQSFRIFLELLGISRTWLSLAQGNMRQNLLSCYRANLLPFQKAGGILTFRVHPWPLAVQASHIPYPHPKSGELLGLPIHTPAPALPISQPASLPLSGLPTLVCQKPTSVLAPLSWEMLQFSVGPGSQPRRHWCWTAGGAGFKAEDWEWLAD